MWGTSGSAPAPAPSPAHPTRKGWRSQLRRLIVRPVSYPQTCNPRCTCWFGSPSPGAGLSTWGRPGGSVVETGMAGRDEERALDGEKKLLLPGPLQGVLEEDKPPEPDCPWPRRVSTRHGRSVKRGAGREGYVGSFVCCSWSVNMKKVTHERAGASLQETFQRSRPVRRALWSVAPNRSRRFTMWLPGKESPRNGPQSKTSLARKSKMHLPLLGRSQDPW